MPSPSRTRSPRPTDRCRFCGERKAVELPELGALGRYPLFCSVADAALYGVLTALEETPASQRAKLRDVDSRDREP